MNKNTLRRLLPLMEPCDHPFISIRGIADDGKAVYRCDECDDRVIPWESETEYLHDPRRKA